MGAGERLAKAKRIAELKIKNPETAAWHKYDKKTKADDDFVPEKLNVGPRSLLSLITRPVEERNGSALAIQ